MVAILMMSPKLPTLGLLKIGYDVIISFHDLIIENCYMTQIIL